MPEPGYVTRLRRGGGPSHQLLVLLDEHRVLTTAQLARATVTPERTVLYRLTRLRDAQLVDHVRPGRESGSAPLHWWLRPAGARIVAGVAPAAEARRPSGLHVAHAAAISEVWLAIVESGPQAGVELDGWWTDRRGWQEWETRSGRARRLTPDAVAHLYLPPPTPDTADRDGAAAAVFIEVDLATMTQTLLVEKVARYHEYAAARAWDGVHPMCPPLLLLTTTPTRAATFARAARRLVDDQVDHDDGLAVYACGLVRDPAAAVTGPVWKAPDPAEPETTLVELLADRVAARARAYHHQTVVLARQRREDQVWCLGRAAGYLWLEQRLGGPVMAAVLRRLVGPDPQRLLDAEPELAQQILDWWNRGTVGDPAALVAVLRGRYPQVWAEQARALLAAAHPTAGDDPLLTALAARLAGGQLLDEPLLRLLDRPEPRRREQIQAAQLGDWPTRRDAQIARQLAALGRRERRHADPAALAARLDAEQLLACPTCALRYPWQDESDTEQHRPGEDCPVCGFGRLVHLNQALTVPTLAQHLDVLRTRLADPPPAADVGSGDDLPRG